jgi:tetratricopeptide (TPR) repeat protein
MRGDVDAAGALADEMLSCAPRTFALRAWTDLRFASSWHRGRPYEAVPELRATSDELPMNPAVSGALALALADSGDLHEAREQLVAELAALDRRRAEEGRLPLGVLGAAGTQRFTDILLLAEACMVLGEAGYAHKLYELIVPYQTRPAFNGTSAYGSIAHALGVLSLLLGRLDEADDYFAEAEELEARWRMPFFLARTRLAWARMLLTRGRPGDAERAVELLQLALATAVEYGCDGIARDARELLGSHGSDATR